MDCPAWISPDAKAAWSPAAYGATRRGVLVFQLLDLQEMKALVAIVRLLLCFCFALAQVSGENGTVPSHGRINHF